jgi:hypothetical protein
MLLSLDTKRLLLIFGILVAFSSVTRANVCDQHLSRIKYIDFEGNRGVDAHYDALISAGRSAVPCLIANVTNTRHRSDPRPTPGLGNATDGDVAIYVLVAMTGVDTFKMLPRKYRDLYQEMGVLARDKYLQDHRGNRRILQNKLWRWYRTTYLPSLPKGAT